MGMLNKRESKRRTATGQPQVARDVFKNKKKLAAFRKLSKRLGEIDVSL